MMSKFKIAIFLFFTFYVLRFTFYVNAQHFSSDNYIIDWGNFNITSGHKYSAHYSLTDTVGQNAPGQYNSTGFKVKSGFQYIYDTFNQFSFAIDDLNIALGTLAPGVGSTDSNIVTITTPSGHGYQIMARENHPLRDDNNNQIADTSCNPVTPCTSSFSNIWTDASAYGFGFNATGIGNSGTTTYFSGNTYYRPFSPNPEIFMSENYPVKNHSARITYRANVSPVQAAGNYENSIIFIAVPKY